MVTNVTSLLKTVKTVEDEHQRGTRALEASIEAIAQEIRVCSNSDLCYERRSGQLGVLFKHSTTVVPSM